MSKSEKPDKSPRARVLAEAADAVLRDRANTYGPPEDSFRKIASLWNGYLDARMEPFSNLTSLDVCNMLELLKIARSISNPGHFDNYTDRAGYAACAADLAQFIDQVVTQDGGLTDDQKAHLDTMEGE
jgi:hypothetical protein